MEKRGSLGLRSGLLAIMGAALLSSNSYANVKEFYKIERAPIKEVYGLEKATIKELKQYLETSECSDKIELEGGLIRFVDVRTPDSLCRVGFLYEKKGSSAEAREMTLSIESKEDITIYTVNFNDAVIKELRGTDHKRKPITPKDKIKLRETIDLINFYFRNKQEGN
jgi:hypothetical protein